MPLGVGWRSTPQFGAIGAPLTAQAMRGAFFGTASCVGDWPHPANSKAIRTGLDIRVDMAFGSGSRVRDRTLISGTDILGIAPQGP